MEVAHRVYRSAIDANFVVHVRTGGTSAHSDIADGIAPPDLFAYQDVEA